MDIPTYHAEVKRTTSEGIDFREALNVGAMGLAGETGEVVDTIKKFLFHHHDLDRAALYKELGDVLWYLTLLCNTLGISLAEIMDMNAEKLRKRYPDGWDPERSINRTA